MADPVRVIVHTGEHGLGPAVDYYTQFPWEPSPAGNLTLDAKNIVSLKDATLETVLQAMSNSTPGGTILLVCHAYNEGLLMPIAKGALGSAGAEEIGHLIEIAAAQRRARGIRAMPTTTDAEKKAKIDAWLKLNNDVFAEAVFDPVTLPAVERAYEKWLDDTIQDQLFLRTATRHATLTNLIQAMERVQGLKLARVELRACDIGRFSASMKKVKELFGCGRFLAPTVTTFYLKGLPITTLTRFNRLFTRQHPAASRRKPGPAGTTPSKDPTDFVIDVVKKNPGTRILWEYEFGYIPPENPNPGPNLHDGGTSTIKMKRVLAMIVEEVGKYQFRGSAGTWHEQSESKPVWEDSRSFVQNYIMRQAKYQQGSINIAGFWTPDDEDPWLLPNEEEYLKRIKEA